MATNDSRRSLTEKEHTIRLQFNAAHRDDPRRDGLWSDLTNARGRGARYNNRRFVMARLRENLERVGWWLVADLSNLTWVPQPQGGQRPYWIGADAPCDLSFDTALPPCGREGKCPHPVAVYIEESDNYKTLHGKRAMKWLRKLTGRQPKP